MSMTFGICRSDLPLLISSVISVIPLPLCLWRGPLSSFTTKIYIHASDQSRPYVPFDLCTMMEKINQHWTTVSSNGITSEFKSLLHTLDPLLQETILKQLSEHFMEKYKNDIKMLPRGKNKDVIKVIREARRKIYENPIRHWRWISDMLDDLKEIKIKCNQPELSDETQLTLRIASVPNENRSVGSLKQGKSGRELDALEKNKIKEDTIKKLEKKLKNLEKQIEQLVTAKVDLKDEKKSSYLKLQCCTEKYQKHLKEYNNLILKENDDDDINNSQPLAEQWNLSGICKYPEIEKEVKKFLISRPCSSKANNKDAPDYYDILTVVEQVNEKVPLNIHMKDLQGVALEVFDAVMKIAKKATLKQLKAQFLEAPKDPADADQALSTDLKENERRSSTESEVIESFVEMEENSKNEEDLTSTVEDSDEDETSEDEFCSDDEASFSFETSEEASESNKTNKDENILSTDSLAIA